MADLTYKDWGRIYAYMWLQDRVGNPYYKKLLETQPVQAVTEVIQALNKEYPNPDLKIEYTPNVDAICEVIERPQALALDDNVLKLYRAGRGPRRAKLVMRLVC